MKENCIFCISLSLRCVLLSFQLEWKLSLLIKCMKASLRPIYEKKPPHFLLFLDVFLLLLWKGNFHRTKKLSLAFKRKIIVKKQQH